MKTCCPELVLNYGDSCSNCNGAGSEEGGRIFLPYPHSSVLRIGEDRMIRMETGDVIAACNKCPTIFCAICGRIIGTTENGVEVFHCECNE